MVIRWFLFETAVGVQLLAFLERQGLALVDVNWLGSLPSSEPKALTKAE